MQNWTTTPAVDADVEENAMKDDERMNALKFGRDITIDKDHAWYEPMKELIKQNKKLGVESYTAYFTDGTKRYTTYTYQLKMTEDEQIKTIRLT